LSLRFSVITPSLNQGRFIKQTIESVLGQNYPNFEHIIADGGSTDETLSILESYPHLIWSSAADAGQADALNKLLASASGEIIAWINADDWYGDDVFSYVAEQLANVPIVVGQCVVTDEFGSEKFSPPLASRTWFDMLKYWVPYSIPPQPAIFFRREILELARRADGTILDASLKLVMDWDLWLRLAEQNSFAHVSEKIFAYYRMSENNKTSESRDWQAENHQEISRVFRTAEKRRFGKGVKQLCTADPEPIILENYRCDSSEFSSANLILLGNSANLRDELLNAPRMLFENDDCGVVVLSAASQRAESGSAADINVNALFSGVSFSGALIRRAVLEDCGKFPQTRLLQYFIRYLSLCSIAKFWRVKIYESPSIPFSQENTIIDETASLYTNYTNAQIIVDAAEIIKNDLFAWVPRSEGVGIEFSEELLKTCRQFLLGAPPNWFSLEFTRNLEQTVELYPDFSPALKILSRSLASAGSPRAMEVEHRAQVSHAQELVISN